MTHEHCAQFYSDWQTTVHCSFENVFTPTIAHIVGANLQNILGIKHFRPDAMARDASSPCIFTCQRREANDIRDKLIQVTTESYSHIWFSMQTDPFHFIYNRRSMVDDDSMKVKQYPVFFYFGSMYTYSTFHIHSKPHPVIYDIDITKWNQAPETIRIMSKDKTRQIFIPVKWIQKKVLVNTNGRPCVVLMLKYSVKMKRKATINGKSKVCRIDEEELETIVSRSSDLLLSFNEIDHTYAFLSELTKETDNYRNKFKIYFVSLKQVQCDNNNNKQPFNLPRSASHKQHYALKMLYSMGYVFQDKYSKQMHDQFVAFDKELFNNMCYYLKEKLEENHCYMLNRIFDEYNTYLEKKRKKEQEYSVQKLPYSIGCISLTPLRIIYHRMESPIGNRALRMRQFGGEDMFLLVHIREEDNQALKDFDSSIKCRLKSKMIQGIKAMGRIYRLFGTSTSQLKEMSFWFAAIEDKPIEKAWEELGNFSSIKNVANYVARIGLYFSTSHATGISFKYEKNFSPNMQYVATTIDDIETKDKKYCFTDGIGKMSWGIAGLVAPKLNIKLESRDDIPSAYQVRIAGCKGMLVIDPKSKMNDYYIKVRPSMEKFQSDNWELEVCKYSEPLELRFNNQVIMLLSDLRNPDAVFESYQNTSLTNCFAQNEKEQQRKLKFASAKEDLLKNRIPLPLNEARNMFGVADETGTLEYSQVFIQYKNLDPNIDKTYIVVTGDVLVAKMPCLHPGDFRRLTAIDVPQLRKCIRDCIVFPTKGKRPHPNEMSGSDLDGDQYWVYWGKQLKIREMDEPLSYESLPKKVVPKITYEDIIDHIVESFGAGSQGIICDVHLAIADSHSKRTRSDECRYLAELFARAVDAPKTGEIIELDKVYKLRAEFCRGYPEFMKKYDQPIRQSDSILNKLFLNARRYFFTHHETDLQIASSKPILRSDSSTPKVCAQRKTGASVQDEEFQEWLISLNIDTSDNTISEAKPILANTKGRKSAVQSFDTASSIVEVDSSTPSLESSIKGNKKKTNIQLKKEQAEDNQTLSTKEEKLPVEPKPSGSASIKDKTPKQTKAKAESINTSDEPFKLTNSATPSVSLQLSASASSISQNTLNRNIVFNGMTAVTNRLKWVQIDSDVFTVDLDSKGNSESNAIDKIVNLMLDLRKTASFSTDNKLTLTILWGELNIRITQKMNDTKPKNIKELAQLIKDNNDIEILFKESDIKSIVKEHEPSSKSAAVYVLICRFLDTKPNDIALIFDDKKKLKKISFASREWICAVRGDEDIIDSYYEIRYLNSLDILTGKSPQISIASEQFKPGVQIISLQRLVRCDYVLLSQRKLYQGQFSTLTNLEWAFYHVTRISTENINGKISTQDVIEFQATPIQLARKCKQDLKNLCDLAKRFFG
ncbi:unnamed protein product [Rotaria sordida]|uniref:RNA-dependent RNA polymerase n=1 Tax=Rotaria sordida TaxID=392033 RepID=A0A819KLL2_9BILA|nr:unnamed protein product [Rotaria sordida]